MSDVVVKKESNPPPIVDEIKIKPTGIRSLSPERIEALLYPKKPKDEPSYPLEFLIRRIMMLEKAERKKSSHKKIKEHDITWDSEANFGFNCLAFLIKSEGTTASGKTVKRLGAKGKQRQVHRANLFFFFREKTREIVALTENKTWEIVRRYTDYSWPKEFCRHFLDPRRITHATRETIFGTERRTEISYTSLQRLELLEARDCLYPKLVLPFRREAPILKLAPMVTKTGDVAVSVQVGQIRIHHQLTLASYPIILDHISAEIRKELTEKALEQFELLDYMEKVDDDDERAVFEESIQDQIIQSIMSGERCELSLCHKYVKDYLYSTAESLVLRLGRQKYEVSRYATFQDLLDIICLVIPNLSPLSAKQRRSELQKFKLSYDGEKFYPLLDFIEGEIRYQNQAYFRINKCFYRLSGDYLSLVHVDFRRSLKDLLMPVDDPGALPLPWGGTSDDGHVTATQLGGKNKLEELEAQTVCYLDQKAKVAIVRHTKLIGEILECKEVKSHREEIENYLNGRKQVGKEAFQKGLKLNDTAATTIWNALTKKRKIFKTEKGNYCVVNPLVNDDGDRTILEGACFDYFAREKEGPYNEKYLERPRYIVGDRVCPFGIEIFDVAYTVGGTTYIYHVKEGFDLHARDALDQLLNSVEMIYEARSADSPNNVLDEWYKKAINPKGSNKEDLEYRKKLAKCIEKLGLENFKKIFLEKKLVFVYAVLDGGREKRTLSREMDLKESFSAEDFKGMVKTGQKTKVWASTIFQSLKEEKYLDRKGRLSSRFFSVNKAEFSEGFNNSIPKEAWKRVYDVLKAQASQFNSTIALLTLRRTRKKIKEYNFDFRICQIQRPSYDPTQPFTIARDYVQATTPPAPSISTAKQVHNNNTYMEKKTRGDGACSLHALNGNQIVNGHLAFVVKNAEGNQIGIQAKRDYIGKIKEHKEAYLTQYLHCIDEFMDYYPRLKKEYEEHMAPYKEAHEKAKEVQETVFMEFLDDAHIYPEIFEGLRSTKQEYKPYSQTQLKRALKKERSTCANAFNGTLNTIHGRLNQSPAFQTSDQALLDASQAEDEAKTAFLTSKKVLSIYEGEVLKTHYHLSDIELCLAAHLYNKCVTLFCGAQPPQTYNSNGAENVMIEHEGNHQRGHYSRLEVAGAEPPQ